MHNSAVLLAAILARASSSHAVAPSDLNLDRSNVRPLDAAAATARAIVNHLLTKPCAAAVFFGGDDGDVAVVHGHGGVRADRT
jgi:hypothetical protein